MILWLRAWFISCSFWCFCGLMTCWMCRTLTIKQSTVFIMHRVRSDFQLHERNAALSVDFIVFPIEIIYIFHWDCFCMRRGARFERIFLVSSRSIYIKRDTCIALWEFFFFKWKAISLTCYRLPKRLRFDDELDWNWVINLIVPGWRISLCLDDEDIWAWVTNTFRLEWWDKDKILKTKTKIPKVIKKNINISARRSMPVKHSPSYF